MFESYKIMTMRGGTHVFSTRDGKMEVGFTNDFLRIRKNGIDVAFFPTRNVEAVLRITDIDGEVVA